MPRTLFAALALGLLLASCASLPPPAASPLERAGQLMVVTTADWNAPRGELRTYERASEGWREVGAARAVTIGRAGAAWGLGLHAPQEGLQKREGDGRSPAGMFVIGDAFGYAAQVGTGLPYSPMRASHWCVDVPGSPLYNRIVDTEVVGTAAVKDSTEPMRRDIHVGGDQRYALGFVIEHNAQAVDRGGSCIFAHVWKSPSDATAGCTAMSEADMRALLGWLRKADSPRFVLLPRDDYARLRAAWRLP